jgi:LysM repeat protein
MRFIATRFATIFLLLVALAVGVLLVYRPTSPTPKPATPLSDRAEDTGPSLTPSSTIPPYTPLATLTPSRTLKPPPTLEPPTNTVPPSATPTLTLTPTFGLSVSLPPLYGAETPTPSTTPGCTPREDWTLTYVVQRDDALATIAEKYNTTVNELVAGNCLKDPNVIQVGQHLRVPGGEHPAQPAVDCIAFELLTPANGTQNIAGGGPLTFNWRGPHAPRNLIRIHMPDGGTFEVIVELRQSETIDLINLPAAGTYTWYIYPLGEGYEQVCPEGGPWTFTKAVAPTATPTEGMPETPTEEPTATEEPLPTDEPPP